VYTVTVALPDGRRYSRDYTNVRKQEAKHNLCAHVLSVLQREPLYPIPFARSDSVAFGIDPAVTAAAAAAAAAATAAADTHGRRSGPEEPNEVQELNELVQRRTHQPPQFGFDPVVPSPSGPYTAFVRVPGLPVFTRQVAGGTAKRLAKRLVAIDALRALQSQQESLFGGGFSDLHGRFSRF
jgi:hypothetical protein